MFSKHWLVGWVATLAVVMPAMADVIGADCWADGDGAVTMGPWTWYWDDGTQTANMNVPECQHWAPAHIFTEFITDTPEDPFAWILKEVENDTTFDWTDYHINISAPQTFGIVLALEPTGWLSPVITPPTLQGSEWVGAVDYYYGGPGTEILMGGTGEFGVRLQFTGSVTFCIEQIPTPEPSSLALLALGAVALLRRR